MHKHYQGVSVCLSVRLSGRPSPPLLPSTQPSATLAQPAAEPCLCFFFAYAAAALALSVSNSFRIITSS